jgi:hypothetical protein
MRNLGYIKIKFVVFLIDFITRTYQNLFPLVASYIQIVVEGK